jgi:hypothetical protein
MGAYSNVDILGREMGWKRSKKGAFGFVDNFIKSFTKSVSLEIEIPTNVFIRTNLLCEYIQEQLEVEFHLHNFIMLLYLDFINTSIKKYNPLKTMRELNKTHEYGESIKLVCGNDVYVHHRRESTFTTIYLEMDKNDILKGEMLLYELDEILNCQLTFEKMIGNIWINFIEEYKRGNETEALNAIIKMLKSSLKNK